MAMLYFKSNFPYAPYFFITTYKYLQVVKFWVSMPVNISIIVTQIIQKFQFYGSTDMTQKSHRFISCREHKIF